MLTISRSTAESVVVLTVTGPLTDEARQLMDAVQEELDKGAKRIILDLGKSTHVNSMGIGYLLASFTKARKTGADIVLANITKKLHDLMQITKLYTVFPIYKSVQDAVMH